MGCTPHYGRATAPQCQSWHDTREKCPCYAEGLHKVPSKGCTQHAAALGVKRQLPGPISAPKLDMSGQCWVGSYYQAASHI